MLAHGVRIVHLDPRFVAVAKPSGLPVVPTRHDPQGPNLRSTVEAGLGRPVWVVHRIDQGTSGLVILALDAETHRALSGAFEGRRMEKVYLAVCRRARPDARTAGCIDVPLAQGRKGAMHVARPRDRGAKAARTRYRVVGLRGDLAVVEARPETGRTHQIRVHLAHAGWPLAFDPRYGEVQPLTPADLGPAAGVAAGKGAPAPRVATGKGAPAPRVATGEGAPSPRLARLSLHALRLTLPGDLPGGGLTLEAPPPQDLAWVLAGLLQETSD